jgi:hypothetical protein
VKAVTAFRDLSDLVTTLRVLFAVGVVLALVSVWSGLEEYDLLRRAQVGEQFSESEVESSDSRQAMLGGVYLLLWLVTFVLFLRWTYQSNRNARFLGGNNLHHSPGWSVGWYFVPIAGLWKPYQALKEMFQASHPDFGHEWAKAPHPKLLFTWWLLFVLSTVLGQLLFRTALRAETLDEVIGSSQLMLVSDLLDIPLCVLGFMIVTHLWSLQQDKRARTNVVVA